jgi:RNA polymerase-binding transcription factor DksA
MNMQHYKQRLLGLDKTLSARTKRALADGRREFMDSAHRVGEASVADETASEEFTEAELDSTVLKQVRDASARVNDGTFGRRIVDGEPIEEKRHDSSPAVA